MEQPNVTAIGFSIICRKYMLTREYDDTVIFAVLFRALLVEPILLAGSSKPRF